MYKDKSKQRLANKAAMQRKRQGITEGITKAQGITGTTRVQGITDDMMDKLTDPWWRGRLAKICNSFQESSHPDYMMDVWLGDYNMAQVCELLAVTE